MNWLFANSFNNTCHELSSSKMYCFCQVVMCFEHVKAW